MINKAKKTEQKIKNQTVGNENADSALLKEEEQIRDSAFNTKPYDTDFKDNLKNRILSERHKEINMKDRLKHFWLRVKEIFTPDFTLKRFVPAVATVTLVAVLFLTFNIGGFLSKLIPLEEKELPFARFFIDTAYAHENFEVTATEDTVTGVLNSTGFKIVSKTPISDKDQLAQSIRFIPDSDFSLKKISDTEFLAEPKNILEDGAVYKMLIGSASIDENGLQIDYDYSWAFQVQDTFKIVHVLPANESSRVPVNSGIEVTFSTDKFSGFEEAFSISPEVKGKFEKHGRTMVFVPEKLDYETVYTVMIRPTVGVEETGEKLKQETVFQFATKADSKEISKKKNFYFYSFNTEFNIEETPIFGVYGNDVKDNDISVAVYAFNNIVDYESEIKKYEDVPSWAYDLESRVDLDYGKLNKIADYQVKLFEQGYGYYLSLPSPLPVGDYVIIVDGGEEYFDKIFVQITDLAVYYNVTDNKTMFWVNDLKTGLPISNVLVKDVQNENSKRTGGDGVAVFDTPKIEVGDSENRQFLVSVDGRNTLVTLSFRNNNVLSYKDFYWLYFYTDRAKYQPTDEINFWGVVKSRGESPELNEVTVSLMSGLYDYNYEPISLVEQKFPVDNNGNYLGKLSFENIVPGYYRLQVTDKDGELISSQSVSIETYVKPSYRIEIKPARSRIYAGEKDEYVIKTSFFDGTPVSNIELYYNYYNQGGTVTTDEDGLAYLSFDTRYSESEFNYYGYQVHTLEAIPVQTEESDIRENTGVVVYGSNLGFFESNIKGDNGNAQVTAKIYNRDLENIESNYFSDPAKGVPVVAEITEVYYEQVETGTKYDFINKVSYKTYSYDTHEKRLEDVNLQTGADGSISFSFPTEAKKSYHVRLVAWDIDGHKIDSGTMYHYASEKTYSDYGYEYYSLKEKDSELHSNGYKLGENAEFDFIKNEKPVSEENKGKFLYFLLQRGLIGYEVNDSSHYSVFFADEYVPNVSLGAVWFDGKHFRDAGIKTIRFDKNEKKLNISVDSDKEKYVPGEEVTLKIKVTDQENKGKEADVNLDLVDEAFATFGKSASDPLSGFYTLVSSGFLYSGYTHIPPPSFGAGAELGGCFLAGTKIRMSDGSEKNIEDIKTGDSILTFKDELSQEKVMGKVVKTFEHLVDNYLIINDRLFVTPEHRVFINGGWQMIGEAKVGDFLTDESGMPVEIKSIEKRRELVKVYNFEVEPEHTYFANGIYVHNDKGGDRQYFPDLALFKNIHTNSHGEAEITFTLPDNITSWIVTAQAFSQDISVGLSETKIPVSLPVFTEVSLVDSFVVGDKPLVKLRSYGDALKTNDSVKYFIESESLGLGVQDIWGKSFEQVYFDFPDLKTGDYSLRAGVEAGDYRDAVIKNIQVVDTRLETLVSNSYLLNDNPEIKGGSFGMAKLVFTDKNRGQYYYDVSRLRWSYGERVDQKLSSVLGFDLLKKYFDEPEGDSREFIASDYQSSDGGVKLLPYDSSGLELSAKVSSVASEYFDQASLSGYFYDYLNRKDTSKDETCEVLYGLANLNEPVLLLVRDFSKVSDLSVKNRLYLGLAAEALGDKKLAFEIYAQILNEFGEEYAPYKRLSVSDNKDEIIETTALAAVLGSKLADENAEALWLYVEKNRPKDLLVNLEKIGYLDGVIPQLPFGPSKFYYEKDGERVEKTLERGRSLNLSVLSKDLPNMKFGVIEGNIAVMSKYYEENQDIKNTTDFITIDKTYYNENNQEVNNFKEGQIVRVQIHYKFEEKAYDGNYEIVDILPSGLKYVSGALKRVSSDMCLKWYPNEVNGQKIRFYVNKDLKRCEQYYDITFYYYARVANLGEFKVEPVMIQSVESPDIRAFSSFGNIILEKR